ncbi:MAG: response regulator [Pseudomonadota bacterium]
MQLPNRILVVDDEPLNLELVEAILAPLGYDLSFAQSGEEALEKVMDHPPDMILLDVIMPDPDGFQVARRLKENEGTSTIPIVMVTALNEVKHRVRALESGADDFLTKPIDKLELVARVQSSLKIKAYNDHMINYQRELEKHNEVLKENARLREDIERITQHDLKSPLTGIINLPNMVMSEGNLSEKQEEYLQMTVQLGYKMLNMINLSLDLYKMEQGVYQFKPLPVDILPVIADILQENRNFILSKKLTAEIILNGRPVTEENHFTMPGENLLFYSMLANLIKNAFEASPREEKIAVYFNDECEFSISIHNQGTVPEDIRDSFFEKYVTSGKNTGTGLGTYSAKLIAETQGGQISLDTSEEDGTTIRIIFPKKG